jgi:hypothetical protein
MFIQRFILVIFLLHAVNYAAMGQKFEKALEKAEEQFIMGDYKKALKTHLKNEKITRMNL